MRIPRYISPSSLSKYEYSQEEYYLGYCADKRPPRFPQTQPMSIGSAFDAYVKAYLSKNLFGEVREGYSFTEMFEEAVEKQHHDRAIVAGKWAFECYRKSGALADLMLELELAIEEPRFEFKVEGRVSMDAEVEGIKFLGKPDLFFKTRDGAHVIFDWKVNGWCSKSGASPKGGYLKIRDGWDEEFASPSRGRGGMHKNCQPMWASGLQINVGKFFEQVDKKWADQLTIYGWVLGEPVGAPLIIGIEQLCCKPGVGDKPLVRVASHRGYVSAKYQKALYDRALKLWKAIHSGRLLDEENWKERQATLDLTHQAYGGDGEHDDWFEKMTRRH